MVTVRIIFVSLGCFFLPFFVSAQSGVPYTVDIVASVPGCGDGFVQSGEQCDGNLGGTTCSSLGFGGGSLSCSSVCTFVTDQCVLGVPSQGRSGATQPRTVDKRRITTNLVVSGMTVPGATVTLLRDGQVSGLAVVRPDGTYQITTVGLAAGTYLIQVSVTGPGAQAATSDTALVRIVDAATTKVTNLVVPLLVQSLTVTGDMLSLRAVAISGATVVLRAGEIEYPVLVGADGTIDFTQVGQWSLANVSIEVLYGDSVYSRQYDLAAVTSPSRRCLVLSDPNGDCRVNILDFAAMSFVALRGLFTDRFDFDNDGVITIRDFSILAYYWTG
jgi:hypothetical protein